MTYKTLEEAAAYLGRHRTTVGRWLRQGLLGAPPWSAPDLDAVAAQKKATSAVATAPPPSTLALTDEQRRAIRERYSDWPGSPQTVRAICADLGITRAQFAEFRDQEGFVHSSEPVPVKDLLEVPEEDLVEDALEMARGALAKKFARAQQRADQEAAAKWNAFEASALALADRLAQALPKPAPFPHGAGEGVYAGEADPDLCLVLFPTDLHFGKRGDGVVGPGAYDRATARRRLFAAVSEVWSRCTQKPAKIVLFTGSDGCHIDSAKGQTTKGTPQDMDGSPTEIATGYTLLMFDLVRWCRLRGVPVEVRLCPGNHDKFVSRIVHAAMQSAFAEDPMVDVASSFAEYQAFTWGDVAVLTHHGDGRFKVADLAQVFATHFPLTWGSAKHRVALRGNLHHTRDEEAAGLRSILLPSLSGQDEYHALNWPVGGAPAMRAPLLHKTKGIVAIFETTALDTDR